MMGLPISKEITAFSNDNMIRFALNVAVQRYSDMLQEKTAGRKTGYFIDTAVVNKITDEFLVFKK